MKRSKVIALSVAFAAIVISLGFYSWQQSSPQTRKAAPNSYSDDYLSFEYPEDVDLLFTKPFGGRSDSQGIEFLIYDQKINTYRSSGLRLSYMVSLGEGESSTFANLDEIEAFYLPYDLQTQILTIDDRLAFKVVTEDMTGETFFLVIPANQSGDAYRFNGSFMSEAVEEILAKFMETANLKN